MFNSKNIQRRPVNYNCNNTNNSKNLDSKNLDSKNYNRNRPLKIYIGDMVQVIDSKSHVFGKFGLVEELHPKNPQYNVIVKIGPVRNPLKFSQLKFCTRISPTTNNGFKTNRTDYEIKDKNKINELIEDNDNIGNRDGANLEHGVKL